MHQRLRPFWHETRCNAEQQVPQDAAEAGNPGATASSHAAPLHRKPQHLAALLPGNVTSATTLVPAATLKAPFASSLPSPAGASTASDFRCR